jgi:YafQ family addiction module toxin component
LSGVDRKFKKLSVKNPKQILILDEKIDEICRNPFHKYKNLRYDQREFKRVHIDKSFVLIFRIDHNSKTVIFCDYDHHDRVYRNK